MPIVRKTLVNLLVNIKIDFNNHEICEEQVWSVVTNSRIIQSSVESGYTCITRLFSESIKTSKRQIRCENSSIVVHINIVLETDEQIMLLAKNLVKSY